MNGNVLWISTIKGLLRFDIASESFRHYLPGVNFSYSCAYRFNDNKLLFGTSDGFVVFDPEQVSANNALPEAMIAGIKLFNREVGISEKFNGDVILPQAINQTKEIALNYKNNVFTIEFIGLHFANPENNRYAYKMEGFDKDWIYTDASNRAVTYTNLDAGTYTFKVKAAQQQRHVEPATRITDHYYLSSTLEKLVGHPQLPAHYRCRPFMLLVRHRTKRARQKNALRDRKIIAFER